MNFRSMQVSGVAVVTIKEIVNSNPTTMDELTGNENYLHHGKYPDGLSKGEKANLRHKCQRNFLFEHGLLYYRSIVYVNKDRRDTGGILEDPRLKRRTES